MREAAGRSYVSTYTSAASPARSSSGCISYKHNVRDVNAEIYTKFKDN